MTCKRLLMLGLLLGLPAVSQGAVLTFAFEGTVDTVMNRTPWTIDIHPGDRAILTYTFDSNAPHNTRFTDSYDAISASLRIGDDAFAMEVLPAITVQVSAPQMFSVGCTEISGLETTGWMSSELFSDNSVFPNDSLPLTPPDLSLFFFKSFHVTLLGPTGSPELSISGTVDSSYAVPEPLSAMLLGIGSLLMGGLRRSRRR